MSAQIEQISSAKSFAGCQKIFKHHSSVLNCDMKFGIYLPDSPADSPLPVLYYLSGLTCSETNFIEKSGFQRFASEHRVVVVNPDTSPRGVDIEGDSASWDFGKGAGFYVDATAPPWNQHYRMYSYVTDELPAVIHAHFPQVDATRQGIFGHSMGGHGALVCAMRNPGKYRSVSAFAPISHPINCPWGQKAFTGYLGAENKFQEAWKQYDACELGRHYHGPKLHVLVDQGSADSFLPTQLDTPSLVDALGSNAEHVQAAINMREGYDHSYFFIATFIGEHFTFHAKHLQAGNS